MLQHNKFKKSKIWKKLKSLWWQSWIFPEKIGKNGQTWKEQLSKSNLNFSILFSD